MALPTDPSPLQSHQNITISEETQKMLNQPLAHSGLDEQDKELLKALIEKIEKAEIKLHQPSSLLNHAVYDALEEAAKEKAEFDAFNLLATIREIYRLWQAGDRDTYQIENLVHKIRMTKERLEEAGGDLYII